MSDVMHLSGKERRMLRRLDADLNERIERERAVYRLFRQYWSGR